MAINKNHLFEDIEGVKCAVVESGVNENRMQFLKSLLELNGYTVVVAAEAEKKPAVAPAVPATSVEAPEAAATIESAPPVPVNQTYKIGVTDVTFNAINAIFGRLLKTANKRVVTMAYWQQKEEVSHDEIPYFEKK